MVPLLHFIWVFAFEKNAANTVTFFIVICLLNCFEIIVLNAKPEQNDAVMITIYNGVFVI
jgi:hypothetical protein